MLLHLEVHVLTSQYTKSRLFRQQFMPTLSKPLLLVAMI
jgi:hypothetical protein